MPEILQVTVDETTIPCRLRRSARARRLRLVVSPGRVEVVAPLRLDERHIRAFLASRSRWLFDKTRALQDRILDPLPERLTDGAEVLYRNEPLHLRVRTARLRRATLSRRAGLEVRVPRTLTEPQRQACARRLVVGWLRRQARRQALEIIEHYAPRLGTRPSGLRIGSQKTLWGSCSSRDVISLNWRLMAAPRPIFEYVVVHELCHLVQRNHGPEFWRLVGTLLPDYRERRAWLKRHGVGLR